MGVAQRAYLKLQGVEVMHSNNEVLQHSNLVPMSGEETLPVNEEPQVHQLGKEVLGRHRVKDLDYEGSCHTCHLWSNEYNNHKLEAYLCNAEVCTYNVFAYCV